MEIWYGVNNWNLDIEELEVIKSTEKQLVLNDKWSDDKCRRTAKIGHYHRYFPTHQEAILYIEERLLGSRKGAEWNLENANKRLAEFYEKYPKDKEG